MLNSSPSIEINIEDNLTVGVEMRDGYGSVCTFSIPIEYASHLAVKLQSIDSEWRKFSEEYYKLDSELSEVIQTNKIKRKDIIDQIYYNIFGEERF